MVTKSKNSNENLPTLSVVIVNKNGGLKLENCLRHIAGQDYPKNFIEILIVDGGSTDNSAEIAKKYGAKFAYGGFPDNQEARRGVGAKLAKNEIIVWLDGDNYILEKNWLSRMVAPFQEDSEIFASQTLRYHYDDKSQLFNRYCALFGVNDPVAFYLGKADRITYYQDSWPSKDSVEDRGDYFKVKLFPKNLPTVGCNGFLIKRAVLDKVITRPEEYFHIDVIYDLVKIGFDKLAVVKNDIFHDTSDTLGNLIRKRVSYFENHGIALAAVRRYKVFDSANKNDILKLILFVFYTVTIVKPLFDASRGFIAKRDFAWFLHPIVCFMFLYAYGLVIIKKSS